MTRSLSGCEPCRNFAINFDVRRYIGGLTALTEANFFGNQLTSVPAQLGGLRNLTALRLSGNRLTSVPAELGGLTALTVLWQGLTFVHLSAELEPCLTPENTLHTLNTP